ncbi:hypothetical protein ABT075_12255 [Streptomyces sp. NPDC002677]|uniref:hypothetical protein n=1 Tax=Streptomyces sp. NPDC002677 TaxID=3154774 RepID=UPI00331FE12E
MTTRFDEEPEFDGPDDPLTVVLRPPAAHLGPPPGRYEEIRRAAGRRRLVRAAAGAGVTCAVALLVALPLRLTTPSAPVSPRVPLAPPAVSPTAPHRPPATHAPAGPTPSPSSAPRQSRSTQVPTQVATRAPSTAPSAARVAPSEDRRSADATPSPS